MKKKKEKKKERNEMKHQRVEGKVGVRWCSLGCSTVEMFPSCQTLSPKWMPGYGWKSQSHHTDPNQASKWGLRLGMTALDADNGVPLDVLVVGCLCVVCNCVGLAVVMGCPRG